MLIKEADSREADIAALADLLAQARNHVRTRQRIEEELRNVRAGITGEREAAHEIDFYYGTSPKYAIIHDLRLEMDGRVAQIDHLLIARFLAIWVCETKHFAEGVGVNERGEWVSYWHRRPRGIPSPVEQNRKHQTILQDIFEKGVIPLPKRLGMTVKPEVRGLVLVSNRATISRPVGRKMEHLDGLDSVIKADQLDETVQRQVDGMLNTAGGAVRAMARFVSVAELRNFSQQLAALHKPTASDWPARFGLRGSPRPTSADEEGLAVAAASTGNSCVRCHATVSERVAAYCAAHPDRFGGQILCFKCQRGGSADTQA